MYLCRIQQVKKYLQQETLCNTFVDLHYCCDAFRLQTTDYSTRVRLLFCSLCSLCSPLSLSHFLLSHARTVLLSVSLFHLRIRINSVSTLYSEHRCSVPDDGPCTINPNCTSNKKRSNNPLSTTAPIPPFHFRPTCL